MKTKSTLYIVIMILFNNYIIAQNIYNGEPVQVVGTFNGFNTLPYNTDYRTTNYRVLSTFLPITTATGLPTDGPKDGRGQWATTIQIPSGDATALNMPGGGGGGFLLISGPTTNRFQNKWAFNGVGQGAIDGINDCNFSGTTDMGLDLSTNAFYTFVMNDCGYTSTNAKYYVGKTAAVPVTVNLLNSNPNPNNSVTVNISSSATPSVEEHIYLRYVDTAGHDFSGNYSTYIIEATGSGTSWTAVIPPHDISIPIYYYLFTSTRTLAQELAATELDRSLAVLNYNDNAHSNYMTPTLLPVGLKNFAGNINNNSINIQWQTCCDINVLRFELEKKKIDGWENIGTVYSKNLVNGSAYSFTDVDLFTSNLYRLKTIERNGNYSYSNNIVVNYNNFKSGIELFPTLVQDKTVTIHIKDNSTHATIAVIDMEGKLVQSKKIEIANDNTTVQLELPTLKTGNYFIKISTENITQTYKVFVH